MTKKLTTEQFIEKAIAVHGDKFDYSKTLYINEKIELKIICKKHDDFLTLPSYHIKSDTGGCTACFEIAKGINKIIIHDNKYGQFITSDLKAFNRLKNLLSFKTAGVEYTAAYKNGWNGITYLLDKNGYFLVGLLSKVIKFTEDNQIPVTLIDKSKKNSAITNSIDLNDKLKKLNLFPRNYQNKIVETAIANNKGIVRACTGSGKCNSIDSLNITEYGLLDYSELQDIVNIKLNQNDIIPLEMELATPLTNSKVDKSSLLYYDGYGVSRKITTNYGFTLTATPNHKIQIINDQGEMGWEIFNNLKINDYAVISFGNQLFGKEEIPLDDAYWYGLLIGDGCLVSKTQTKLTNMDSHILSFAKKYIQNNNIKYSKIIKTKSRAFDIVINNRGYRKKLENFGFDYYKSINKTLPINIRKLEKKSLAMVIRGIYEADGWVENTKGKPCLCLGLSNKKLIDQIHLILLNFGIIASRRIKKTAREDSHILTIYKEFIPIFIKEIGLYSRGRKYRELNWAIKKSSLLINNANTNVIPHQHFKIEKLVNNYIKLFSKKSLFEESPIKSSTIISWSGIAHWRMPSKEKLLTFINWYKNKLLEVNVLSEDIELIINDLLYLCENNFYYLPISKIEETYSDNYDFVVPKTHSFVSQGFINHNTFCTALITAKINKPTIIYVIGLDLLKQFHDLFSLVFDEPIGFIGNGTCDIQRINIASIWTISSALKIKAPVLQDDDDGMDKEMAPSQAQSINILNMLKNTKLHIFDESHVVTTETIKQIFNKIDPEYIYGFSGTPFRDDGSDLLINSILGDQIINVPASELIADGYLAQPIIKFVRVPKLYIEGGATNYQTVYKAYITDNIIRNKLIVENTKELLTKNYQVLVLFKHLQHGKNLQELFDAENIKYEYLSGTDSLNDRTDVKNRLASHESNLILASTIYDIGVDLPSLSALILAGGGKSSIRALQRIGRVIRKTKTKKHAAIVDFYDDVRFLKGHSKKRYQIYSSETGFKLIVPKSITDLR